MVAAPPTPGCRLPPGHLDFYIFLQTLGGLTIGAYLGAKLTRLASRNALRYIVLSMPTIGGLMLLFK